MIFHIQLDDVLIVKLHIIWSFFQLIAYLVIFIWAPHLLCIDVIWLSFPCRQKLGREGLLWPFHVSTILVVVSSTSWFFIFKSACQVISHRQQFKGAYFWIQLKSSWLLICLFPSKAFHIKPIVFILIQSFQSSTCLSFFSPRFIYFFEFWCFSSR